MINKNQALQQGNQAGIFVPELLESLADLTKVTYEELVTMRDNGSLVPGHIYRLTDYQCTTTQEETQSAGNQFDLIITAIDEHTLSENCGAALHDGDTHFINNHLEAWEVKYSLDNDITRFAWADTENGKGVIYYMKDEFANECPYDFKNIQFKRYKATSDLEAFDGKYVGILDGDQTGITIEDEEDFIWMYTFSILNEDEEECIGDQSINDTSIMFKEYIVPNLCRDNIIRELQWSTTIDEEAVFSIKLNNNVLYTTLEDTFVKYPNYSNTFGNNCDSNTFGNDCHSNTFGNGCSSNTFGNYCMYNTFGNYCNSNTFGNDCNSNTFGNDCSSNTFGNDCNSNTFGNDCHSNTFGNDCNSNTFGNDCHSNTFGNGCSSNTFGNDCNSNTFGNGCNSNTFGNYCNSNTFGNYCDSNTFGNDCHSNTFGNSVGENELQGYIKNVTLFDGCQYLELDGGSDSSHYVQNAQVLNGTIRTGSSSKLNIAFDENKNYTQVAGKNSSGTLKIWTPADLIE